MSSARAPAQLWSTMPGWGIAADLTPPELINSRELKTLRKWIGAGLVVLLLACTGGYLAASRQNHAAAADLATVNAETVQLQSGVGKYATVTQIQGNVSQIQAQIATLMSGDVDLVTLMGRIRRALPAPMAISNETVTIILAAAAAAPAGTVPPALASIGTVTIAGTGSALDNLATYVEALQKIPGVINVNPTTNVLSGRTTHYSLSLTLTAAAFSHRFDVSTKRAK
jgi:hypothetical protein